MSNRFFFAFDKAELEAPTYMGCASYSDHVTSAYIRRLDRI